MANSSKKQAALRQALDEKLALLQTINGILSKMPEDLMSGEELEIWNLVKGYVKCG